MKSRALVLNPDEQRAYGRITTALSGKLFVPAEEITLDCRIVNISGGGAGVVCDEPPPLNTFVVLYIDGFGRFECAATRYVQGELGLRFVCKEAKRQRLLRDLACYVAGGVAAVTRLRLHTRVPSVSAGYFQRENGKLERCDILDFSLQGISLRTSSRPPVGEIINLGSTRSRVVRHHEEGIALLFVDGVTSADTPHGH